MNGKASHLATEASVAVSISNYRQRSRGQMQIIGSVVYI